MKLVGGIVKLLALLGGAVITFVGVSAIAGTFVSNGWARFGIALAAGLLVPLVVAEVALARFAPDKRRGVTSDVMAVMYAAFALVFVGFLHGPSRPLLQQEGDRLAHAGWNRTAKLAWVLAGGRSAHADAPAVAVKEDKPAPKKDEPKKDEPKKDGDKPKTEMRAGDGKERTPSQLFTEFAPSVVTISVKGPMGEGGGTGFIIDSSGTIGTNYHVIQHATELQVKLMDGTVIKDLEILAENEPQDLALLRVKTDKTLPPVALGDSDKITVGERAVSIGNPLGLEHTLTDGLVSARRVMQGRKMIQMSTPVSPGNSGGPVFNSKGEVIGVTTAIYLGGSPLAQNLNLAMPINDLKAMIKDEYPNRHKVGEEGGSGNGGRW
ncbi:MAG: trypsin-like peptidase domain-containing protein [Kofleriaceae bacterium]